jgi:RNA polymerase sigma factor (TIGR02999 family)
MTMPPDRDVTRILNAIGEGDREAAADLLPLVYDELRNLARHRMANEPADHTLQATALVHEAYLRLIGPDDDDRQERWDNRGHFFGAAARAMRRILVERARRKGRLRHGGDRQRIVLDENAIGVSDEELDLVALDDAIERLEANDARKAEVVMLRYFAGLSIEETARAMSLSIATVNREWAFARAWLRDELTGAE